MSLGNDRTPGLLLARRSLSARASNLSILGASVASDSSVERHFLFITSLRASLEDSERSVTDLGLQRRFGSLVQTNSGSRPATKTDDGASGNFVNGTAQIEAEWKRLRNDRLLRRQDGPPMRRLEFGRLHILAACPTGARFRPIAHCSLGIAHWALISGSVGARSLRVRSVLRALEHLGAAQFDSSNSGSTWSLRNRARSVPK